MAQANGLSRGCGTVFQLTHRYHNRAFLLKFARAGYAYRAKLRDHVLQFDVAVLDCCLTSNRMHLLVDAPQWSPVSRFMRPVASVLAGVEPTQPSDQRVLGRQTA